MRAGAPAALRLDLGGAVPPVPVPSRADGRHAYAALWERIIEGAGNIAYRLAYNSLLEAQAHGGVAVEVHDAEVDDLDRQRALVAAIAAGDETGAAAHAAALLGHASPPRATRRPRPRDGRGPLLRRPVLHPAARGRGAVLPAHLAEDEPPARVGYEQRDTLTSLSMGSGNLVINVAWKARRRAIYAGALRAHAAAHLRMRRLVGLGRCCSSPTTSPTTGSTGSRTRAGVFWASHVVHHSSQHYNLSTALRQTWVPMTYLPFWLPLPLLGFPPWVVVLQQSVSLIYQFGLHTERVGRLPRPIERSSTPRRHHRVHHGSNPQYLDRNYGGILVIWDRLFGSFEPEDERVRYGLTKNLTRTIRSMSPSTSTAPWPRTCARRRTGAPARGTCSTGRAGSPARRARRRRRPPPRRRRSAPPPGRRSRPTRSPRCRAATVLCVLEHAAVAVGEDDVARPPRAIWRTASTSSGSPYMPGWP